MVFFNYLSKVVFLHFSYVFTFRESIQFMYRARSSSIGQQIVPDKYNFKHCSLVATLVTCLSSLLSQKEDSHAVLDRAVCAFQSDCKLSIFSSFPLYEVNFGTTSLM